MKKPCKICQRPITEHSDLSDHIYATPPAPEDWVKVIDEFVRDITSVVPKSKSEVRRRILDLLARKEAEHRDSLKSIVNYLKTDRPRNALFLALSTLKDPKNS